MDDSSSLDKRPDAGPVPAAEMRASDADRDRYAEFLRDALAEGRLTAEEHGQRLDRLYAAKTVGELQPLVRDLPAAHQAAPPPPSLHKEPRADPDDGREPSAFSPQLIGVFSGATRRGRWRVPGRLDGFAMFGGIDLDFTEAVFEQREVTVNVVALFGGADIRVPENVTLRSSGAGIFGGFDVREHEAEDPNAPVVTVKGFALFGGVTGRRKKGRRLKDLNRRRGADREAPYVDDGDGDDRWRDRWESHREELRDDIRARHEERRERERERHEERRERHRARHDELRERRRRA